MLVTKEQARKLQELGFNKPAPYFYNRENFEEFDIDTVKWFGELHNHNIHEDYISAPTISEALNFMREEKGIECWIQFNYINGDGYFGMFFEDGKITDRRTSSFEPTHPLAEKELLDAVIKYIEENEKRNQRI